jgi:hypothetical protein
MLNIIKNTFVCDGYVWPTNVAGSYGNRDIKSYPNRLKPFNYESQGNLKTESADYLH